MSPLLGRPRLIILVATTLLAGLLVAGVWLVSRNACDPGEDRFEALRQEEVLQVELPGTKRVFASYGKGSDPVFADCQGPDLMVVLQIDGAEAEVQAASAAYQELFESTGWTRAANAVSPVFKKDYGNWVGTAFLSCPSRGSSLGNCQIRLSAPSLS